MTEPDRDFLDNYLRKARGAPARMLSEEDERRFRDAAQTAEGEDAVTERAVLRSTMEIVAMCEGGSMQRIERVAALSLAELLPLCHWPNLLRFTVHDKPGEHDPCYLVQPGGAMVELNHWNDELTDVARAVFIARSCNTALASLPKPVADTEVEGLIERLRRLAEHYEGAPASAFPDAVSPQLLHEAADKLAAQVAEIERLNAECEQRIEAYQIAFDQAMANGEAKARAEARVAELTAALERLGSTEAFVFPRAINPERDAELLARIDFARAALHPPGDHGGRGE